MSSLGHARRHTTFAAITSIAAAALLSSLALMSAWVYAEPLPSQVYATAVGEIRAIVLDRWISLHMNTNTGAVVTAGDEFCDVDLDHGEAMFDVERDGPRVLRVLAGRTVLSTRAARFSVRLRDVGNIDLLVSKGQVTVGTTVIGELQIAKVTPDGMRLRALTKAEAARRFQWIHGRLAFAGEPLVEAVAEFNRYNRRQLVIGDRAISLIPIGGQFGVSDMQSFVAALRLLGVRTAGSDENGIRLVAADGED